MRVSVSEETNVPLEQAWRWWTDFGEPGQEFTVGHGIGKSRRRILERMDGRVTMEDRAPLPGATGVRIARREVRMEEGHRFHESARGMTNYESDWRFEATPSGGTRIVRELDLRNGLADLTGKLGEKVAREMIEKDLEHHVKEMERELRR